MHLTNQFLVIDSQGDRHTVSAYRAMTERSTSSGIEFVPVIAEYKLDDWHSIERIDDNTFRTATGEVVRRPSDSEGGPQNSGRSLDAYDPRTSTAPRGMGRCNSEQSRGGGC